MAEQRCYGCMNIMTGPVCQHCGYDGTARNAPHQLPAGTVLRDQYLVGRALGQGGFGITYLGWDLLLNTAVAIKEYYPNGIVNRECSFSLMVTVSQGNMLTQFQNSRERFLREAQILARFSGEPEIVHICNFFQENNTAYIVMEYIAGMTLKQYVASQGGRISVQETFSILAPVMIALSKIHNAGLIHRDISPDNIMMLPYGGVKLLDFGAARDVSNARPDRDPTKSTEAILKHGFAPIEQYQRRGTLGPWTDVYAFCATIYYCVTGTTPKDAPERVLGDDNLYWREQATSLSVWQADVLNKGMAVHPKDRISSIESLYNMLFREPTEINVDEGTVNYQTDTGTAVADNKKSNGAVLSIAALSAIVVFLILMIVVMKPKEPISPIIKPETEPHIIQTESPGIPILPIEPDVEMTQPQTSTKDEKDYDGIISAGAYHSVYLCKDGTAYATGKPDNGRCDVSGWTDLAKVCAYSHTVGLKKDGTVVAAGNFDDTRCDVSGWKNIIDIAVGYKNTIGVCTDGTVKIVGDNTYEQCNVSEWTEITQVAVGERTSYGLKSNGRVVAAGGNGSGQREIYDWSDIKAISAGFNHVVGLKWDGTVIATGSDHYGQCDVDHWTDIIAISAGNTYTIGLKSNGEVEYAGDNRYGQCDVGNWTDIVAISAGQFHTLGIKRDGTIVSAGDNAHGQRDIQNK